MKTKLILSLMFQFILGSTIYMATAQAPLGDNSSGAHPRLSEAQLQTLKSIRAESEKRAAPLALRLASLAKQIYENMLSEKESPALRRRLSREMDRTAAQLLAIKGQSIRDMVRTLTPEQRALVRSEMRKPGAPADLSELIAHVFGIQKR